VCSVPRTTTALDTVELYKKFKLVARDTENLTLWNTSGTLKRYDCVEDIIEEFTEWRIARYEDRRVKLISETEADIEWSSSKIRFIQFYLKNTKLFKDTGKADLVQLLKQNDFHEYEKLLSMPIWNLTRDKILELEKELDELKTKLGGLVNDTAADMYKRELKQFAYA
jgi:DNA topoisomerase-2